MRALQFITDHVIFKLRYNQIYLLKTTLILCWIVFPGLAEQLEVIQAQLSLCEKALAEYLETKRLAFPRFYFASSNDLLDILSNGNQPLKVAKHLTKLFDSMAKLKLREDNPATANNAHAMVAKDGEIVEFHKECRCEGQVEVWLNRLLTTMRDTLR